MTRLPFQLEATSPGTQARATTFRTLHGEVRTPIFMPVGTQATVRSQTVESLRTAGSRVLLANTYHLMLRPGPEVFRKFGGIHRFMNWDGPVLTDSGGYQIFSLPGSREMSEDGARFASYVDRRLHLLSPESSIEMQKAIGSDIMMVLDQCIPSTAGHAEARAAMELTHRWAKRSLAARGDSPQALFGIVQGACHADLRRQSADFLASLPFDGLAIGGLAVGETLREREDFTELTAALLPADRPRYLMGVGTPLDLLEAVHRGVDMFDCVLPGMYAQRGVAFTSVGKLQFRRTVYRLAEDRLDPDCACNTCANYSRAYLHHLHKAEEPLGWTLLTQHNLHFYHRLMAEMRAAILRGDFLAYYRARRPLLAAEDAENPHAPPRARTRRRDRITRGDYELHASADGHWSVRQKSSGEVMHPHADPTVEAQRVYVDQSRLRERLATAPLTIWDVGLGVATNAMSAIRTAESLSDTAQPLRIVSFERDLDPLRLALTHAYRFPHLHHGAPRSLVDHGRWQSADGRLTWELLVGDFSARCSEAPRPDLIYYDFFSVRSDPDGWSAPAFTRLREHTAAQPCELYTYSASTAVRAALLAAGFSVGSGVASPPKEETTIACAGPVPAHFTGRLLGAPWLERWKRSHAQTPATLSPTENEAFTAKILGHPQFHHSVGK